MLSRDRKEIVKEFKGIAPESFWGSSFDVRFELASEIKKIKRGLMLDVGCGPGILLNCRNHRSVLGVGIDISVRNLLISRKLDASVQCVLSDMHYLPFRNVIFDHVIIANSFSSFDCTIDETRYPSIPHRMLINEVCRIISSTGRLLMTTPNRYHRYYRNKRKADCQIIRTSLKSCFIPKMRDFNPLPINLPRVMDIEPVSSIYYALLLLLMKLPFGGRAGMFIFVEATKRCS